MYSRYVSYSPPCIAIRIVFVTWRIRSSPSNYKVDLLKLKPWHRSMHSRYDQFWSIVKKLSDGLESNLLKMVGMRKLKGFGRDVAIWQFFLGFPFFLDILGQCTCFLLTRPNNFSVVIDQSPSRPPASLPRYNPVHHFSWEVVFFSSPDVSIPI